MKLRRFDPVAGDPAGAFVRKSLTPALVSLGAGIILFSSPVCATPADDVARAAVSGAASVAKAQPDQFLRGFTAIVVRAKPREVPGYVTVAIHLRADLTTGVVAAAIKLAEKKTASSTQSLRASLCIAILKAAIAANPDAAVAIAKAAVTAAPDLREALIAAAIAGAPAQRAAILRATQIELFAGLFNSTGEEGANFFSGVGTINPANISDTRGNVNSPEQPPSRP